ncbi:MAG TPA: HAMP domain-containing sensor histidine kinase, partial [Acidimicrobiales bacterium]|nr:HAMP domain-containing sensor histidine kinase [Acidimicrobiales bacterium]
MNAAASGPHVGAGGAWRRVPLWARLVTALLVLAAIGVTLTAAFGARMLRDYLVERVDDDLVDARDAITIDGEDIGPGRRAEPELPTDFSYIVLTPAGAPWISRPQSLHPDEAPPDWPSLTLVEGAARADRPFTVDSATGHGEWRVLAEPVTVPEDGENKPGTLLVATSLSEADATTKSLLRIDLIVGGLVLGGLAVVGYTLVRGAMRPLSDIERTAAAIAGGDLSQRIPDEDPRTEVGRLGRALNLMLGRIEEAFRAREASEATARRSEEKMRRFVADASHELRTPLTSIRGFAELYRQGAVTAPDDVRRLLGRIEDEATRMGLLVEDLLQLARLDQQRPLQLGPVDLVVLAADAVEAARTRAPGRSIRLVSTTAGAAARDAIPAAGAPADAGDGDEVDEGDEGDEPGVVVTGDEARLRQVVTNLLDNALHHTPDDSPVTVRVGGDAENARLEVVDRGPGLTPEQADRVFQRFYRTDTARTRAQGGTGLGLSIVAAIADAHGGRVEVDTAPGAGATFRLLLPRHPPASAGAPPGATDAARWGTPAAPAPGPEAGPPPPAPPAPPGPPPAPPSPPARAPAKCGREEVD